MNQYIKRNLYSLLLFFISLSPLFTFHFPQHQFRSPHETDFFYYVEFESKVPILQEQVPQKIYQDWISEVPYKLKGSLKTLRGQLQLFLLFCFICCLMQSFLGFLIPKKLSNLLNTIRKNFYRKYLLPLSNNSPLLSHPQKSFPFLGLSPLQKNDILKVGGHLYKNFRLKNFKINNDSAKTLQKSSLKKVLSEIQKSFSKELKDQKITFSIQGADCWVTCREGAAYYIFYIIFKAILKRTLPQAKITVRLKKVSDFFILTIIDSGLLFSQESLRYLNSLTGQKSHDDLVEKDQKIVIQLTRCLGWKISYGIKNNLSFTKILIKESQQQKKDFSD
ncbi:MAG TPA: hypothetical protein PLY23_08705 [Alphaproteobacteria bacterium]|nr:hypothetical protein [Alphaproteobacteria bacterium]HQS94720.1 hypothetical protein [Alphaproteobacteria bacterium]